MGQTAVNQNTKAVMEPSPKISSLVAVSKIYARATKQMNLNEWKTFVFLLTRINWSRDDNSEVIWIGKRELANALELNVDSKHLSEYLYNTLSGLQEHSRVELSLEDIGDKQSGNVISTVRIKQHRGMIFVRMNPDYLEFFQDLNKNRSYITMWSDDLFGMHNERSVLFYEDLRLHSDTRITNRRLYTTKALKELFDIPKEGKGSYMHFSKEKQTYIFDRVNFEKKVLAPVCEDLKKCEMINLVLSPDGTFWTKKKEEGHVVGYEFVWTVNADINNTTQETLGALDIQVVDPAEIVEQDELEDAIFVGMDGVECSEYDFQ